MLVFFLLILQWNDWFSGEWPTFRNATSDTESVSGHIVGRPGASDTIFWPAAKRVLLRSKPAQFRRDPLLLPKRWPPPETRQRAARRLLRGDQILWARRVSYQQIQVQSPWKTRSSFPSFSLLIQFWFHMFLRCCHKCILPHSTIFFY